MKKSNRMKLQRWRYLIVVGSASLIRSVNQGRIIRRTASSLLIKVREPNRQQITEILGLKGLDVLGVSGTIRGCERQLTRRGFLLT